MMAWRRTLQRWAGLLTLCLGLIVAPWDAFAEPLVVPSVRVTRNVVIRAQPTTQAEALGRLSPGEQLPLLADLPGWRRVRLSDGREGFVSKAWTDLAGERALGVAKAHVIDVGTGLAVFVEGPGFALLYDAGSQDDLADGVENRVVAYIRAVRPDLTKLDHVILSHPHKDHLELLPDVFDAVEVSHVWDSGRVNPTAGYCRFLKKAMAETGVAYHDTLGGPGQRQVAFTGSSCKGTVQVRQAAVISQSPVPLGAQAAMVFLFRDGRAYSDPNENSMVVRLDLGGHRLLLTGDAEGGERKPPETAPQSNSVEAKLLLCCREDLKADVLVVGHHGSLTSSRTAFLDAVDAKIFAISSGPHPYSRVVLPDEAVVRALEARGQVFRTDLDDDACENAAAKPGPDADESPGGCDNIQIVFAPGSPPAGAYVRPAD